jgi:hypothetical protein
MAKARLRRLQRSRRIGIGTLAGVLALAGLSGTVLAEGHLFSGGGDNPWPYAEAGPAPVLATVGDIACQPGPPVEEEKQKDVCDKTGAGYTTRMEAQTATADQIEEMKPNLVAILGDEQYEVGRYEDFLGSFDKTYGAFKFLHRPSPGNHEFYSEHGETGVHGRGYFDYYNGTELNPDGTPVEESIESESGAGTFTQPRPRQDGQAGHFGEAGDGWYSYDLGSWHLISLNAECEVQPGGCDPSGEWLASETKWLEGDLSHDHSPCTLAYWHQPTFSSTVEPFTADSEEGEAADAWWKLLYAHHATLVLNGHDHVYSRFAPMNPAGEADPRRGIREFIVGTGGESLDEVLPSTPNLEAWADQYYGTMKLTLKPGGYAWDYESAMESPEAPAGTLATYGDTGSGSCHGGPSYRGGGPSYR